MIPIFNVVLISGKHENAINNSKDFVLFHFRSSRVFLELSQNSQENTCARASFLVKLHTSSLQLYFILKKRLWHSWFPANFEKVLRTPVVSASVTYRNILINFMVTLFIRCKFKWAISVKYQLHLYMPRFQNFNFQDFLGTPYINR